ncbi:MAG: hypothetical protein AABX53_03335 [Nanoarchaeota archaeon]
MRTALDLLDPGRIGCATIGIDPRRLDQKGHDFVHATKLATRAVWGENRGYHNECMADMHYLAALCDLAAGKEDFARAQFTCAARHTGYDPALRFGSSSHSGSNFLDHEWREFRDTHDGFDYECALKIFREEQGRLH